MLLGNIERQSLSEIIAGESRAKYMDLVSNQPDDCKACEWYNACHNGCPHHRVGGVNGKYYNGLEKLDRYIRWNFGGKMNCKIYSRCSQFLRIEVIN